MFREYRVYRKIGKPYPYATTYLVGKLQLPESRENLRSNVLTLSELRGRMVPAFVNTDPLLRNFMDASTKEDTATECEHLILRARQIIFDALKSSSNLDANAKEDVCTEACSDMIMLLHNIKFKKSETEILNFSAYCRTCARHAVGKWLNKKHPQRNSIRRRLEYLFKNDSRFALWEDSDSHERLCGFSDFKKNNLRCERNEFYNFAIDNPKPFAIARQIDHDQQMRLQDLTIAIFNALKMPVAFYDMVQVVATLRGINNVSDDVNDIDLPEVIVFPARWQEELSQDWACLNTLSPKYRSTILLQIDAEYLGQFLIHQVATISQLAVALGTSDAELNEVWKHLPLNDEQIADRLDMTIVSVRVCRNYARKLLVKCRNQTI